MKTKVLIMLALLNYALHGQETIEKNTPPMSLERLMNVEVTTLSRSSQSVLKSAASVYVVSNEDIKLSGATSIPEALRYIPGVNVAKIDNNKWAISIRGNLSRFSNKLLVLVNGRTVYNLFFGGVYWDSMDMPIDEVDRIEIIKGPGASLWGLNAVNGIINIITKDTADTKGGLITLRKGTSEDGGTIRYGEQLSEKTDLRLFLKFSDRYDAVDKTQKNNEANDDWESLNGGFRLDFNPSSKNKLTVDGSIFESEAMETSIEKWYTYNPTYTEGEDLIVDKVNSRGGHLQTIWEHFFSETANSKLRLSWTNYERNDYQIEEMTNNYEIDFQNTFELIDNNIFTWGLNATHIRAGLTNSDFPQINNIKHLSLYEYSAFIQDEITVIDDFLSVTLGLKAVRNEYTNDQYQPSIRFLITPDDTSAIWTSVSRAVRVPTILEDRHLLLGVNGRNGFPNITIIGNDKYKSEKVIAYECGYRKQINEDLSFDINFFYNDYDDLTSITDTSGGTSPITYIISNEMKSHTYGTEMSTNYFLLDWWSFKSGFSYLYVDYTETITPSLHLAGCNAKDFEVTSPKYQSFIQSNMNLSDELNLGVSFRYVSSIPDYDINEYVTSDVKIGYKVAENAVISLIGLNLLDRSHKEYGSYFLPTVATEVPRSYYLQLDYEF